MAKLTLQAAIDEYLLAARANGHKDKTIKWYEGKFRQLVAVVGNIPISAIDANVIRRYFVDLRESDVRYAGRALERPGKLSAYSLRGHHQALAAFYNWLTAEYNMSESANPMARIKKPKTGSLEPKAMVMGDFRKMLAVCDDSRMGRRDRAALMFLGDTGCRAGGLVGLTASRLFIDQRRAMVHEKGDKDRFVHFIQPTADALSAWLDVRPANASTIFCSVGPRYLGQPLHVEGLHRALARIAAAAGIEGRFNPHSLRHMFAIENLENGNDLVTVSNLLGHTDLKTTQYYLLFTEKQRAKRHDLYSPLVNL